MVRSSVRARFLVAGLVLAGCSSTPGTTLPPEPTDPAVLAKEEKEGFEPPRLLQEGDRWFVALKHDLDYPGKSGAPFAVRNRRVRSGSVVREEVVWGRTFDDVARTRHGTMQVTGLILDGKGLAIAPLDASGSPIGEPLLEVALPFRPGHTWEVPISPRSPKAVGLVERVEDVETPAGKVRALRVSQSAVVGEVRVSTIWYDRGLRPVRFEFRQSGALVEAHAALASAEPSQEECRRAIEWAGKHLAK